MRKSLLGRAVLSTAVGAAALTFATPASAVPFPATVWTTTPGSGPFTATTTSGFGPSLTVGAVSLNCSIGTASGSLSSALGNPAQIAAISLTSWGPSCTSALGPVSVTQVGAWKVWAQTYDPAVGSGTTAGYVGSIAANVTAGSCKFTVTGKASATYTNSTGLFVVKSLPGELIVSPVPAPTGCGAVVTTASKPLFKATYRVNGKPQVVGS
ncbi:hypothetical protein ACFQLX_05875 [Streptomyces polyrhachis]|uniref:Tat pathway signal sequence domain protein n=1 Tax=Streptomyces polyrhachis TaxID=1282885 RepID=A0ABW2GAU9_9ACTN